MKKSPEINSEKSELLKENNIDKLYNGLLDFLKNKGIIIPDLLFFVDSELHELKKTFFSIFKLLQKNNLKEILIPTINLLHSQDIKIDSPYLYISDEKYELLSLNDFFDNLSDHDLGKEFIFFLLLSWIKESSYFLIKINGEMYAFFREEIEENVSETKENVNKALH